MTAIPDVTQGPLLVALRRADPARWARAVRAALRSRGTVAGAANVLAVERRTLQRWLAADESLSAGLAMAGPGRPSKNG